VLIGKGLTPQAGVPSTGLEVEAPSPPGPDGTANVGANHRWEVRVELGEVVQGGGGESVALAKTREDFRKMADTFVRPHGCPKSH